MTISAPFLQLCISHVYYCSTSVKLDIYVNYITSMIEDIFMPYPDHFPDDCPPDTAHEANGDVYRFTSRRQPKARDFKSKWEEQPGADFGDKLCMACGISIFTDLADVVRMRQFSAAQRKKFVAKGTLSPEWGELLHTAKKGSHHTWWMPTERLPWTIFETIEVPDE
jgi:hypothetical protein